jgi:hypothetical protein
LTKGELQQKAEWLFQAEDDDLLTRAAKKIAWTREIIDRLEKRTRASDLSAEAAELAKIEQKAAAGDAATDAVNRSRCSVSTCRSTAAAPYSA